MTIFRHASRFVIHCRTTHWGPEVGARNSTNASPRAESYHAGARQDHVPRMLRGDSGVLTYRENENQVYIFGRWKQITFGSVISCKENLMPSRPRPEYLMPPKGMESNR